MESVEVSVRQQIELEGVLVTGERNPVESVEVSVRWTGHHNYLKVIKWSA